MRIFLFYKKKENSNRLPFDSVSHVYFVYFQRTSEPMHCTCTKSVDLGKYIYCDSVDSLDEHFSS